MSAPRPCYVLVPAGGFPPELGELLPGRVAERVADPEALRGRAPGALVLPVDLLRAEDVLAALRVAQEAPSEQGWLPLLLQRGVEGAPVLVPLSLGWPAAPAEVERWLDGADEARVLELRHVLDVVARGRHDLNNPLTSALAETQLALLDATDPALRQGLETIEAQLRRIRDLIAGLRSVRPPA